MARKKGEKALSPLHRPGEAASKVPADAAFRAPCFEKEDRFWEAVEEYKPREDASGATMAIEGEEGTEASLFKPESVWRLPIKRGSVPWSPIAYEKIGRAHV